MAYGTIKVDTVTFTDGGVDKSVSISGLVQNPTFSGNITVTGTVSGNTIQGQTVSGVTVTGTTALFSTGTFISLTGTTSQGTTATYTSGSFTSLTGVTTSGTTANFVSGVFSTQISGATVTGNAGAFTTLTGGVTTITSGVFAAGSAANPSISFTSDPDTGLYSPGANSVALSTNGTGRLFVDASGNVGVGASSPTRALDVNGSIQLPSNNALYINGSNNYLYADSTATELASATLIKFVANGSERLRITSAGLVGIGTSSIRGTSLLDARGDISFGSNASYYGLLSYNAGTGHFESTSSDGGFKWIRASGPTTSMTLDSSGRLGIGTSSPGFKLTIEDSTTPRIRIGDGVRHLNVDGGSVSQNAAIGTDYTGSFGIYTDGAANTRFHITSTGLVGIGTTSPGTTLEVNGGCQITGSASGFSGGEVRLGAATADLQHGISTQSTGNPILFFDHRGTGNTGIFAWRVGTNGASERMRIDSSGRLGIGTTSPSETLHVVGNGRIGNNTTNPDFTVVSSNTGNPGADTRVGTLKFAANANNVSDITAERNCGITATTGSDERFTNLDFYTSTVGGGAARVRIDSSGRVGIGTSSPGANLHVQSSAGAGIRIQAGSTSDAQIDLIPGGTSDPYYIYVNNSRNLIFQDFATERARIDSSGRLLVGTSSGGSVARLQVQGSTLFNDAFVDICYNGSAASGIAADTSLGLLRFTDQASNANIFAQISCATDAAASSGDYPGRLVFSTTADGASSPTERLRITSTGQVRLAGAGITFNGDTATANELDDYEEGTWTPAITGSTTAGTVGYDNQVGKYTKIGRQVTVSCNCDTAIVTTAPTGDIRVSGLPFTPSASSEFVGAADLNGIPFPASATYVVVEGIGGQTYVQFYACGTNVASSLVQANSLATDDYIRFTLTYFV